MKIIVSAFLLLISMTSFSQTAPEIVKFNNPAPYRGYSHSVEIDLATCKMVIVSGQVALDKQGNLVGKDDLTRQTE